MLSHIVGPGAVFAFADDIAICIRSLSQLRAVHKAFSAFAAGTSLQSASSFRCGCMAGAQSAATVSTRSSWRRSSPTGRTSRYEARANTLGSSWGRRRRRHDADIALAGSRNQVLRAGPDLRGDDNSAERRAALPHDLMRPGTQLRRAAPRAEPRGPRSNPCRAPEDAPLPLPCAAGCAHWPALRPRHLCRRRPRDSVRCGDDESSGDDAHHRRIARRAPAPGARAVQRTSIARRPGEIRRPHRLASAGSERPSERRGARVGREHASTGRRGRAHLGPEILSCCVAGETQAHPLDCPPTPSS